MMLFGKTPLQKLRDYSFTCSEKQKYPKQFMQDLSEGILQQSQLVYSCIHIRGVV